MNPFQVFVVTFISIYVPLRLLVWALSSVELTITVHGETAVIPFWTKFSMPGGPVFVTLRRYTVSGPTARIKVVKRPW